MKRLSDRGRTGMWTAILLAMVVGSAQAADPNPSWTIQLDQGHPWRPPFGLERVSSPLTARVERSDLAASAIGLVLSARAAGREVASTPVEFAQDQRRSQRIVLAEDVDEVVLIRRAADQSEVELARAPLKRPELEADALAVAETLANPVDLGAILPPTGWLLVESGKNAVVDLALLSRSPKPRSVEVAAWFETASDGKHVARVTLEPGKRQQLRIEKLAAPTGCDRTTLHVAVTEAGQASLWQKAIPAMLVSKPPEWPAFGAKETLLRYDAPISVRDPATGTFSTLSYENAWRPELRDVVVSFPSGARFVFWRGSSYIPFWAGKHNTGLCYEWAEHSPPMPPGAVDCVEPLMDKELRYGRVQIIKSTPARVHVYWRYQSTDFQYKVWGDAAGEEYFFYPDGFGTRSLDLTHEPKAEYELSELILLTAANTPPFSVVPQHTIDAIALDGKRHEFLFPGDRRPQLPADMPAIYRVRMHADEPMTAIYFTPRDGGMPPTVFGPFAEDGELVTPTYWGSHWPLARGNATGWKIDDRMVLTPCHNSLVSWASRRPQPLRSGLVPMIDTLGQSRDMVVERWAWLIGMTDASDEQLLKWARSFAQPPRLTVTGGSIAVMGYAMERRALRIDVEQPQVKIAIEPSVCCMHPVFELNGAPEVLRSVRLAGEALAPEQYAWDGWVLWLGVEIDKPTTLELDFAPDPPRCR